MTGYTVDELSDITKVLSDNIHLLGTIRLSVQDECILHSEYGTAFSEMTSVLTIHCIQTVPTWITYIIHFYKNRDRYTVVGLELGILHPMTYKYNVSLFEYFDMSIIHRLEDHFGVSIMDKLDL